jgi:hypothetical protein
MNHKYYINVNINVYPQAYPWLDLCSKVEIIQYLNLTTHALCCKACPENIFAQSVLKTLHTEKLNNTSIYCICTCMYSV